MSKLVAQELIDLYNEFGDDFGGADESDLWRGAIVERINNLGYDVVREEVDGLEIFTIRQAERGK